MDNPDLSAEDVARKAMTIAADMCIYTNHNFLIETLESSTPTPTTTKASTESETTTTTKAATESEKKSKPKK